MELPPSDDPKPLSIGVVPRPVLPAAPGDEDLFRVLYERMQTLGVDHASRFLSTGEAKDVVCDALCELWERWSRLTVEQRTIAYFLGAIHYHILRRLRENRKLVGLDDAEAELSHLAVHEIDTPTRGMTPEDVLDVAVEAMPPRRRLVFQAVREHFRTYKEIGDMLSMSEGTVNTHMRLAYDDVRAALRRHGFRLPRDAAARLGLRKRAQALPASSAAEGTDA